MFRVTVWLQLLLMVLILWQSAAVSDQCSQLQEDISRLERDIVRITELKHNELRAGNYHEHLKKQRLISQATARKLKESEAVNSGLKKQLDKYKAKFQQSKAVNSGLKKQLDEYKTKFQQSEAVTSGLKKQVEAKEEVLKSITEKQTQVQTTNDGQTKTMESLDQTVQHVCQDLLKAAKSGKANTVKILFKHNNDNCTADGVYRNTPLLYAAWYGHVKVVRVLLEGGANVDRANADQDTALHVAAQYGHLDVCRLLLDWGAKVDPLNKWKYTPLHWAALLGRLSVVKLLVERGADVRVKDDDGRTASDWARRWGRNEMADWLDRVRRG